MRKSNFFAVLFRMKYINRWSLMRNTEKENLKEHSFDVAAIAHALCVIGEKRCSKKYDTKKAVLHSLYHDSPEIFTGDMPTPVKYYSEEMRSTYKKIEKNSAEKILSLLPDDLREEYAPYISDTEGEINKIVKAADKLAALIKCKEEMESGNKEFKRAYESQIEDIKGLGLVEADVFLELFLDGFSLTLDDME